MSSELAIHALHLGKAYRLYERPVDRLKQMLFRGRRRYGREFVALEDVCFELKKGEVLGIVGRNGAGKSTLLQIICRTLTPTSGSVEVNGRVAALLELGAGFNPDFTGQENVYLNASILGLTRAEIEARYEGIVDFSGIGEFIHQPVKTYSSGMYMRLAFAVATSVDPDILVIDEALSVGDGEFARKSFDRIMALRDAGKTILFCSHSMYQIEAICNRALWLDQGRVALFGTPAEVVSAYDTHLALKHGESPTIPDAATELPSVAPGGARIVSVEAFCDQRPQPRSLSLRSKENTLSLRVRYAADPALPPPSLAVAIVAAGGQLVASAGSHNDGVALPMGADGRGAARLVLPHLSLLKGDYNINVFLICERGVHIYDHAPSAIELRVAQTGLEQGLVSLPHHWEQA